MNWLDLILHYFPVVLQGVIAVEQSIGSKPGATKKQVVLGAVVAAAKTAQTVDEKHVQAISAVIDSTVTALNEAGVFGKPPGTVAVKPA